MIIRSLPNIISSSRGIAAVGLLFTLAYDTPFWVLYAWCGLSDMIDGPLARKLGATSELGAKIDSISDLVFFVVACIKVIPTLDLPCWLWCCIGFFALAQVSNMATSYFRNGGFPALHNTINRILGLLLYFLPIIIQLIRFASQK